MDPNGMPLALALYPDDPDEHLKAYQTFYVDLPLSDFDYVENLVTKTYKQKFYLIAHEQHNAAGETKPHFHFIVYTTKNVRNNILKKIIGDRNLKVTGKGGYRPYGTPKKAIQSPERLKIYCTKDGLQNVRSSISDTELQKLHELSFKKVDTKKLLKDKFTKDIVDGKFKFPISPINGWGIDSDLRTNIRQYVIQFHIDNDLNLLRSSIERWSLFFIQVHPQISKPEQKIYIYFFLYN